MEKYVSRVTPSEGNMCSKHFHRNAEAVLTPRDIGVHSVLLSCVSLFAGYYLGRRAGTAIHRRYTSPHASALT